LCDLGLLSPFGGICCLVVAAEQEDDSIAMCMTENAKQEIGLA
jgi:hypothetical protein